MTKKKLILCMCSLIMLITIISIVFLNRNNRIWAEYPKQIGRSVSEINILNIDSDSVKNGNYDTNNKIDIGNTSYELSYSVWNGLLSNIILSNVASEEDVLDKIVELYGIVGKEYGKETIDEKIVSSVGKIPDFINTYRSDAPVPESAKSTWTHIYSDSQYAVDVDLYVVGRDHGKWIIQLVWSLREK